MLEREPIMYADLSDVREGRLQQLKEAMNVVSRAS